jgi:hypothetical protein
VIWNLVKLETVFKAGTVQATVALVFAFSINLSAEVTGLIEGGAAAVLGLLTATVVDQVSPTLYTGLLTAAGTLAVAFGVPNVSSGAGDCGLRLARDRDGVAAA